MLKKDLGSPYQPPITPCNAALPQFKQSSITVLSDEAASALNQEHSPLRLVGAISNPRITERHVPHHSRNRLFEGRMLVVPTLARLDCRLKLTGQA